MRASPACQVSLQRFGVWRAGLGVLAVIVIVVIGAWVAQQPAPVPRWLWSVATASMLASLALAWSLARVRGASLRWDGHVWLLDDAPGTLAVAIDLGGWMLLRFAPEASPRTARAARWLPVQRRGLEGQWHALRCAVYTPTPSGPR